MNEQPIIVLGFDPGLNGGMASIRIEGEKKEILSVRRLPLKSPFKNKEYDWVEIQGFITLHEMLAVAHGATLLAVCEKIVSWSGKRMDKCLESYGGIRALMETGSTKSILVTPSQWKKKLEFPPNREKEYSIEMAKQRWPELIDTRLLYPSDQCDNESDGMADALLIAEAGLIISQEQSIAKTKKPKSKRKTKNGNGNTTQKSAAA